MAAERHAVCELAFTRGDTQLHIQHNVLCDVPFSFISSGVDKPLALIGMYYLYKRH